VLVLLVYGIGQVPRTSIRMRIGLTINDLHSAGQGTVEAQTRGGCK
jgi:hypothetical protein